MLQAASPQHVKNTDQNVVYLGYITDNLSITAPQDNKPLVSGYR